MVIGSAVTRDGLPVSSWVFPGNTADVTTVEKVKQELKGWRLGRCVFVGDAGMNGEDNRRKLAFGGGKYILAAKMRAGDEVTNEVLSRQGRYRQVADNLRVKQVEVGDGEGRQRYVVCHNPQEQERRRKHRERLIEQLQRELAGMTPSERGHTKRMCELKSSRRFGRYVREEDGGPIVDWPAVRREEHYDGKWVITSNDDTLTAEDLALGDEQLMCPGGGAARQTRVGQVGRQACGCYRRRQDGAQGLERRGRRAADRPARRRLGPGGTPECAE